MTHVEKEVHFHPVCEGQLHLQPLFMCRCLVWIQSFGPGAKDFPTLFVGREIGGRDYLARFLLEEFAITQIFQQVGTHCGLLR
uniref:hypothetical protein n=1 Tax=Salmonella sp. s60131 TaxID=3159722 RepID=UPI0039811941